MQISPVKNLGYYPKTTSSAKNSPKSVQGNDFEFSSASANALRANVLSFGLKLKPLNRITRDDVLAKQRELSKDIHNIYKEMAGVYKNYFEPCEEQIYEYRTKALYDYENFHTQNSCIFEEGSDKDTLTKFDYDLRTEYKAEFDKDGELINISVFNVYGDMTHSIEFQGEDVFVFFENNTSAGFKQHGGVLEPRSYTEYGLDSLQTPFIKKRMIFDDEDIKMHYEEAASKDSAGFKIDFNDGEDDFTYEEFETNFDGTVSKGETIRAIDYDIQEWNLGHIKFRNGAFEQYPRIAIDSNGVVEYDEGYVTNISGEAIRRGTYIKNEAGIPSAVLRWLGFKK